ncbi:MAG: hypothetical protein A2007_00205 [Verrucomicrobia bacterium GWC2_42_7]|nr:MAG: hypothetical protein A2007_00205 [Verrucomicrobia bacterium GWC2_42_7]
MSVRIYQIAKQLNLENKAVIELLQGRGLSVESPSNTIPNIYAESFIEEYTATHKGEQNQQETHPEEKEKAEEKKHHKKLEGEKKSHKEEASPEDEREEKQDATKEVFEKKEQDNVVRPENVEVKELSHPHAQVASVASSQAILPPPPATGHRSFLPAGKFVKTAEDIAKEKQEKAQLLAPAPVVRVPVPGYKVSPPPPSPALKKAPTPGLPAARSPLPAPSNAPAPVHPLPQRPMGQGIPVPAIGSSNITIEEKDGKKIIKMKPPVVVRDFASVLGIKPFRLISELMEIGIFASMNQIIDEPVAVTIGKKYGLTIEVHHRGEPQDAQKKPIVKEKQPSKEEKSEPRPPVVCVLGHVDHGKTSLLDAIRKTNVVAGEAGGITQHIGAYQVDHNKQKITFLDTPGHAAFSKMRERGANITDVAVLVVAADDGFMPQTDEALKFAQKANVPVVIAINKMDAKGANIDRVKQQMQQRNIAPEEWGGETLCTPISALKNQNIDVLLDLILLQSEMLDLKAPVDGPTEGVIVESQIEIGRGPTATAIIERGTLSVGDALVCGSNYCKVRAMMDDKGIAIKKATPATPVRIIGWSSVPDAGTSFSTEKNEKEAKRKAEENTEEQKRTTSEPKEEQKTKISNLNNLLAAIEATKQKCLRTIVKGDVNGSVEALVACLRDIKSTKVSLDVLSADVGLISKNDIIMAHSTGASIVAFNTKLENGVLPLAKHHGINIIQHNIIYELITQVKSAMVELLDPELKETKIGAAQVRQVFGLSKGAVAGCMVTEGRVAREANARLLRGKEVIHEGRIVALKRFKEDASEVRAGYECGIQLNAFSEYKEGDVIECFEITKIWPDL